MNTTKVTCNYAIICFRPYPETEEFINVGVVVSCPAQQYFGFRLETSRRDRVNAFFPELDRQVFVQGRRSFHEELERVREYLDQSKKGTPLAFAQQELTNAFRDVVKPRESLFRFSSTRSRLADDPEAALEHLFAYYVERSFAKHKEYQETEMVQRLRRTFRSAKIMGYREGKVGNDIYEVHFPLLRQTETTSTTYRAIKPLDLAKDRPTAVTEHGDVWLAKLEHLKEMHYDLHHILITVNMPSTTIQTTVEAAKAITDKMKKLGAEVLSIDATDAIQEFAKSR